MIFVCLRGCSTLMIMPLETSRRFWERSPTPVETRKVSLVITCQVERAALPMGTDFGDENLWGLEIQFRTGFYDTLTNKHPRREAGMDGLMDRNI